MLQAELPKLEVGVQSFRCVKTNDGEAHPFEIVEGGDGLPVTITQFDEKTGVALGQVVTYPDP